MSTIVNADKSVRKTVFINQANYADKSTPEIKKILLDKAKIDAASEIFGDFIKSETDQDLIDRVWGYGDDGEGWERWMIKDYSVLDWANEQLLAIDIVQENFVWMDSEDASTVSFWLKSKIVPINNTIYSQVKVIKEI